MDDDGWFDKESDDEVVTAAAPVDPLDGEIDPLDAFMAQTKATLESETIGLEKQKAVRLDEQAADEQDDEAYSSSTKGGVEAEEEDAYGGASKKHKQNIEALEPADAWSIEPFQRSEHALTATVAVGAVVRNGVFFFLF